MTEHGMYFITPDYYQLIRDVGETWNDCKERPIVCLIKSTENSKLYWAIPVGKVNHRDTKAINRIYSYMNKDPRNIASCFYHIGKTTTKSIFFISDAFPVTDVYIDRIYEGYDKQQYVIENNNLLSALKYKLQRILSYENANPNFFRQHITDVKRKLLDEINN